MNRKEEEERIENLFDKEDRELFDNVMDEVDERIRITRHRESDKTIIREVEKDSKKENMGNGTKGKYRYTEYEDENGRKIKIRKPIKEEKEVEETHEIKTTSPFILNINKSELEAYLIVHKRAEGPYTVKELVDFLNSNQICYGLNQKMLEKIAAGECYYEEVKIAQGTAPRDGEDGYYEFHFNIDPETRPIILLDGSVDYNTLGKMELVNKDQLLVTYHPALPCRDGRDIFGNMLKAKDSQDLPVLKGSGFDYDEEMMEYYSTIEGKVTYRDGNLDVVPVYILDGNLEAATGDLNFHGDVVIKGNVFANVVLKTTGNITVNGHVEIATLIAGKDVLLKNGMQGSGAGRIYARGDVMAKFLEQTNVVAKGNISANAILNCNIEAGKSIVVSGTRGAILGGKVMAVEGIQAFSLGNRVGMATRVIVGLEEDFKIMMKKIDVQIEECREKLENAERNFNRVNNQLKMTKTPSLIVEHAKYKNEKLTYQNAFKKLMDRKNSIADIRERSINGKVVIMGPVNQGTTVIINGISETLTSERKNVTFSKGLKELRVLSNAIEDAKPGLRK